MNLFSKKIAVLSIVTFGSVFLFSFKNNNENYGKSKLFIQPQENVITSKKTKPNLTIGVLTLIGETARAAKEVSRQILGATEANNSSEYYKLEKQSKLENLDN